MKSRILALCILLIGLALSSCAPEQPNSPTAAQASPTKESTLEATVEASATASPQPRIEPSTTPALLPDMTGYMLTVDTPDGTYTCDLRYVVGDYVRGINCSSGFKLALGRQMTVTLTYNGNGEGIELTKIESQDLTALLEKIYAGQVLPFAGSFIGTKEPGKYICTGASGDEKDGKKGVCAAYMTIGGKTYPILIEGILATLSEIQNNSGGTSHTPGTVPTQWVPPTDNPNG